VSDKIIAQLAALKTAPIADLKARWVQLFGKDPPPYNRSFIESRLAYRIQELAYGGLSKLTRERLEALAKSEGVAPRVGRKPAVGRETRPVIGTQLIREYRGVQHRVIVRDQGFEYAGRLYKSLSVIARQITGTRWNGPVFFGLRRAPKAAKSGKAGRGQA
jgi:hypothetical protein